MIFENGQVAMEFEADTRGDTNGRSFSDCDNSCPIGYSAAQALGTRADDESTLANMPLQHCAIAISFSVSFVMSCRRRASSSKSQAARASTSFILPEISRISFSNLPIESRTRCRVSRHG